MGRKFLAAAATLLAITAIYSVTLYMSIQRHNARNQATLERLPPEWRQIIDPEPFGTTSEGTQLVYVGGVLVVCWGILSVTRMAMVK